MADPYAMLQNSQVSVPGLLAVYEGSKQRRMEQLLTQRKIAQEDKELARKDSLLNIYSRIKRPGQAAPGEAPQVSNSAPAQPLPTAERAPVQPATDRFGSFYDHFLAPAEGGYVASDGRSGAPANFGINAAYHQGKGHEDHSNVRGITPEIARRVAHDEYWTVSGADKIEDPRLQAIHADTAFNMGPERAQQMLEASGGDPERYLDLREQHYRKLGGKDLPGWLNRNQRLEEYVSGLSASPEGQGGPMEPAEAQAPAQLPQPPESWLAANQDLIGEMMTVDPQQAFAMQENFAKMDEAARKQTKDQMAQIGSTAAYLLTLPQEQRAQALQRVAPRLAQAGIDPTALQGADLSDTGLQGYVAQASDVDKILDRHENDRKFAADEAYRREQLGLGRERLTISRGALDVARTRAAKGDSENSDLGYLMGGD